MQRGDDGLVEESSRSGRTGGAASKDGLPPACVPDAAGTCSICGDEGLVGEIVELPADDGMGRVRLETRSGERGGSREHKVALDLLEDVRPGDRVVVHMGFAIARIREDA